MSITKLKTIGSWRAVRWLEGGTPEPRGEAPTASPSSRGRVITGLLTGDATGDPADPRGPRGTRG